MIVGLMASAAIAFVLHDAYEAMLLPRRVQRRVQFMTFYFRLTWACWKRLATRIAHPVRREALLSHFGPLAMLGLFATWATGLILAFGSLSWAVRPVASAPGGEVTWAESLYMSGVTFFTVGYGDVVPHSTAARFISVVESGTGLGFIAVVIGYLPVLYQLFARREAHVIQLDGRAGSPPTAVAMLCRHAEADGLPNLDLLLREWEIWGAELLESHLTYPILAYYRSQHEHQSWLAALTAVLDCCALILVGVKELSPLQARMTFSIARQVVVELSRSFRIVPSRYDGGDRLSATAYAWMEIAFAEAGLAWEGGAEAQEALQALRATYEPLVDGLAQHLLIVVTDFVPDELSADHWERGHRGILARRLVEQLVERPSPRDKTGEDVTLWRNLRRRLRE
jgi:hypothetical protein